MTSGEPNGFGRTISFETTFLGYFKMDSTKTQAGQGILFQMADVAENPELPLVTTRKMKLLYTGWWKDGDWITTNPATGNHYHFKTFN